jgi:hypothetical protein
VASDQRRRVGLNEGPELCGKQPDYSGLQPVVSLAGIVAGPLPKSGIFKV